MFGEDVDEPGGNGDGAAGRSGLCFSESELPSDFGEGAFDADGPLQRLVSLACETGELSEPGAAVGGGELQRSKPWTDGIGEVLDLGGGEGPFLRLLDSRQLDALAGRPGDEP